MRYLYFDTTREPVPVPESINFGLSCVEAPELGAAGVPDFLAKFPVIESKVEIGDWVQRGQVIMQAKLPVFDRAEAPPRYLFWIEDSFTYLTFELRSPVCGLVITLSPLTCAYHGEAWATDSGRSLCYGENYVRPVILLPDDEPPPTNWDWSFYGNVSQSIRINFNQLLWSQKRGYVRLVDASNGLYEQEQGAVSAFRANDSPRPELIPRVVPIEQIMRADRFIGEMRAHNLVLRRKLKHIGGMAASETSNARD
jgi:hypothetical protein